jgi:hypothetical protein
MQTRQDLERRVRELEAEAARLRAGVGAAAGSYACGGGAVGEYVISATRRDPQAHEHFARYGLEAICGAGPRARRAGGPPSAPRF